MPNLDTAPCILAVKRLMLDARKHKFLGAQLLEHTTGTTVVSGVVRGVPTVTDLATMSSSHITYSLII